ncbi:MAG: MBL fold metallo-hydrolase [Candidatus Desulfofervidaceae bacterium]|nr:MBL fold metallo-hydrolase [Candidatus Desulfofervidaceae bacterium]
MPPDLKACSEKSEIEITVVFDSEAVGSEWEVGWGFSCLVSVPGKQYLFDTGENPFTLAHNLNLMGIKPANLDLVFLSHEHFDHIGGLNYILKENPSVPVMIHKYFSGSFKQKWKKQGVNLIETIALARYDNFVYTTGPLGETMKEQALVLRTPQGVALMSGCAHPEITTMVAYTSKVLHLPIRIVIGGFHLMDTRAGKIKLIAHELQKQGVEQVYPCHCTGTEAVEIFREIFNEGCKPLKAGESVSF